MTPTRTMPGHGVGALTAGEVARWLVTFAGFPLGSVLARLVAGPIDTALAALVGGLVNGAVLGAVQVWGLGRRRPSTTAWVIATAVGLMTGLGLGSWAVGYATDPRSLTVLGLCCGVAVGVGQGVVLAPRLGVLAIGWPVMLGAAWALGWTITAAVGVETGMQFTVFGSSGAIVVTALTLVLPWALARADRTEQQS